MNNELTDKYSLAIRILHWAMAIFIVGLVGIGIYMTDLPKNDPNRGFWFELHKSFGITVLVLVVLRVVIRFMSYIPPLPEAFSTLEKKIIRVGHGGLYVLMFLTPFAGYLLSCAAGKPATLFGVELPSLIDKNKSLAETMSELHQVFAYTLLVLAALHALAAIKHSFDKNPERNILNRMK